MKLGTPRRGDLCSNALVESVPATNINQLMKLLYLTLSVIGLASMSYFFLGTFFSMANSNDAVYATLQGIFIAIMALIIALTGDSIFVPLRKFFKFKTIR